MSHQEEHASRLSQFLGLVLSWLIVAFGQPASSEILGFISSVCGYALFWRFYVFQKRRFLLAVGWFALVQCVQLSWMTSVQYVGALVLVLYVLLCIAWGVQFAFVCLWIPKQGPVRLWGLLLIPSLWVVLEWSRLYILSGFPWNPVGLALTGSSYSIQMASITGIYGLSFWVFLVNLLAFNASNRMKDSAPIFRKSLAVWVACAAIPFLFGWGHVAFHENRMDSDAYPLLSVAAVQTSLYPDQKLHLEELQGGHVLSPREQWIRILQSLHEVRNKSVDLILLPESVVPYGTNFPVYSLEVIEGVFREIFHPEDMKFLPPLASPMASLLWKENIGTFWAVGNGYWAQAIANLFQADVIIGLEDFESHTGKGARSYQSAFHFRPNENTQARYEKRVLVPMGEYIPFNWCKGLAARYGVYDSFYHGEEAKVFQGKYPMGVSICYEETYGHLMRENRLLGASMLINLTNDAWYPHSKLPRQHLDHSRLRSVENGFPLLRACNTGVSAMVDSLGRTIDELRSDKEDPSHGPKVLFAKVPMYQYKTLYTFWGDKFIIGFCIAMILAYTGWYLISKKSQV